jgi:hypothetical protein
MKTFRYSLEIDAENRDDAQEQLEEMAAGMSFGDLQCEEIPSEQMSYRQILEHFKVKHKYEAYDKIKIHFVDFDGWLCKHCSASVGNDSKDMVEHLQMHSIEELKTDENGDPIEEDK